MDGRKIQGVSTQDIMNFRDDLYAVLSDEKFAGVRSLIDIQGKTIKMIDEEDLKSALNDIVLTEDESAFISMITTAIYSNNYKIEYTYR